MSESKTPPVPFLPPVVTVPTAAECLTKHKGHIPGDLKVVFQRWTERVQTEKECPVDFFRGITDEGQAFWKMVWEPLYSLRHSAREHFWAFLTSIFLRDQYPTPRAYLATLIRNHAHSLKELMKMSLAFGAIDGGDDLEPRDNAAAQALRFGLVLSGKSFGTSAYGARPSVPEGFANNVFWSVFNGLMDEDLRHLAEWMNFLSGPKLTVKDVQLKLRGVLAVQALSKMTELTVTRHYPELPRRLVDAGVIGQAQRALAAACFEDDTAAVPFNEVPRNMIHGQAWRACPAAILFNMHQRSLQQPDRDSDGQSPTLTLFRDYGFRCRTEDMPYPESMFNLALRFASFVKTHREQHQAMCLFEALLNENIARHEDSWWSEVRTSKFLNFFVDYCRNEKLATAEHDNVKVGQFIVSTRLAHEFCLGGSDADERSTDIEFFITSGAFAAYLRAVIRSSDAWLGCNLQALAGAPEASVTCFDKLNTCMEIIRDCMLNTDDSMNSRATFVVNSGLVPVIVRLQDNFPEHPEERVLRNLDHSMEQVVTTLRDAADTGAFALERRKLRLGPVSAKQEERKAQELKLLAIRKEAGVSEVLEDRPQFHNCPISCEPMVDPVVAADGFTYERIEIETWLDTNSTSPYTRDPIPSKRLIPNRIIKQQIDDWLDEAHKRAMAAGPVRRVSKRQRK